MGIVINFHCRDIICNGQRIYTFGSHLMIGVKKNSVKTGLCFFFGSIVHIFLPLFSCRYGIVKEDIVVDNVNRCVWTITNGHWVFRFNTQVRCICRKFETSALNGSNEFVGVCIVNVIRETTTLIFFNFVVTIANGFAIFIEGEFNSVNRDFFTNISL